MAFGSAMRVCGTVLFSLVFSLACAGLADAWGGAKVDDSASTKKLESLGKPKGERPAVTIYQFRSTVDEISGESGTDMFTTALIKSGHFRVMERAQLNETVMRERELNESGATTGDVAQHRLVGAEYIFEGAVTEANAQETTGGLAGTFRGLGLETSGEQAQIGLDVRVIDARTGEVLDSVNVRKKVSQGGIGASGLGSFVQSFTKTDLQGADASLDTSRKEGVDKAFRECIEEALYQLVKRYGR